MNHIPSLSTPHGLEYPLGSRMHFGVVHPRLEARGPPFPRSPRSRSHVNLRVLRSLTRGPQGQLSPLGTPHGRPGVQGIFLTSRSQAPHGWPMVHHSMATGIPISRGCCVALSVSHLIPCSPLPHPVTGPIPASSGFPFLRGCCAAPFHPSSCVYTPTGRQQPCGAGFLDPHPSEDRFGAPSTGLSLLAPAPFPCAASRHPPRPFPRVPRPPGLLGPSCGPSHTPFSAPSPLPSIPCFYPTGPPASLWRGPTGSASFLGTVRVSSTVCSLTAPLRLGAVLPSGFVVVLSSWPPCPPLPVPFPHLVTRRWFFFLARHPRSLVCQVAPSSSPAARSLCASRPPVALRSFGRVFFLAPPSPPCILPCGSLLPACTYINSAQAISHCSPRCSFPVPSPSWGVALGGPRPCQVGAPPLRLTHFSALQPPLSSVSCPLSSRCSPAPCALRWSSPRHGCISRAPTRLRASALSSDL